MWISPTYSAEYRDWIARGNFDRVYGYGTKYLPEALANEHPALIAGALHDFATCYSRRGIVALLDGNNNGWNDIQCGYWSSLYSLLFEIKAVTLPAWSHGRELMPNKRTEMVLLSGLARLFNQDRDREKLSQCIANHFSWERSLGNRIQSGRKMLQSILQPETEFSLDELVQDRRECCQKRQAWPPRPTEVAPFGVLDIEIILRFPQDAAFIYEQETDFDPMEDEHLIEAIVNYHHWYG